MNNTDLTWVTDGRLVRAVVTATVSADDGVTEVKEVVLFTDERITNSQGYLQLDPHVVRLTLVSIDADGEVVPDGSDATKDLQLWVNGAWEYRADFTALAAVFEELSAVPGRLQTLSEWV